MLDILLYVLIFLIFFFTLFEVYYLFKIMTETKMKEAYLTKKISLVKLVSENEEDLSQKIIIAKEINTLQVRNESLQKQVAADTEMLDNLDHLSETFTETKVMLSKELESIDTRIKLIEEQKANNIILNGTTVEPSEPKSVKSGEDVVTRDKTQVVMFLNQMMKLYIMKMFEKQIV